ncbi:hypothetical protein ABC347_01675 [Sphingomonas sp. 1P06PA]|uniref:hypothetical protein n=1 Tax=Sphingomonas sp. 1P06PA TaxID=554121 RepID=UPI0039A4862B
MALPLPFRALASDHLHISFRPSARFAVEIVERPGAWLPADALAALIADCRAVVRACLDGRDLDYGLFADDGQAWSRTVITLVRDAATGQPIAFNAMPLIPVDQGAERIHVLHLGLVMVDPGARSAGLSWILYGLTCFLLFLRGRMRPLWISSVTQVPAVVGMVAETFDQVFPGQPGTQPSFAHRHIARQIMRDHRDAFGVGADAGFDEERLVITNAYTGGSDNLKKSLDVAAKHRDPRYNDFCATMLDYQRGDDVLQIGQINLGTARRFLSESVPKGALPRLGVQIAMLAVQAVVAPTAQWLTADRSLGRLRPAR